MKKKLIAILLICISLTAITACTDTSDTNKTSDAEPAQPVTEKETNSELTNKGRIDNKYDVEIIKARKGKNYEGKPCIIVTYNFTNNSDSNASFVTSVTDKAFQNSVECETAVILDGTMDVQSSMAEIQPGGSISVESAYCLKDETNIVTIQVRPFISSTNKVVAQMEFNPAQ